MVNFHRTKNLLTSYIDSDSLVFMIEHEKIADSIEFFKTKYIFFSFQDGYLHKFHKNLQEKIINNRS